MLHSQRREPSPDKPQPPEPAPTDISVRASIVARQLVADLERTPAVLDAVGRGVLAVRHPRAALKTTLRFSRSAAKVAGMTAGPGSPLLRNRSLSWRFSAFDVRFADMRAASKVAGASVNDAYLAALVGAFRLYHEHLGQPDRDHAHCHPDLGAQGVRPEGWQPDRGGPAARAGVARRSVRADADDPRAGSSRAARTRREPVQHCRPCAGLAAGPVLSSLGAGSTASNDLQASNVPGIPFDVYMAGAKVERMYPFGPLPGCAVMATMVTHGPVACLGINHRRRSDHRARALRAVHRRRVRGSAVPGIGKRTRASPDLSLRRGVAAMATPNLQLPVLAFSSS